MPENPFEESTLANKPPTQSTPANSNNFVEVRYTAKHRILIPAFLTVAGIIVPIVSFVSIPEELFGPVFNATISLVTAVLSYFYFDSAYVRADEAGITKSQFGKVQSARWKEIADMSVLQVGRGPYQMTFKNSGGKIIFRCAALGTQAEKEKLWEFIDAKLEKNNS